MNNYKIQSVLLNKQYFNNDIKKASKWIIDNNYKIKKRIDITDKYYRFRQIDPDYLLKLGYKNIITKKLNDNIKLIIYYL